MTAKHKTTQNRNENITLHLGASHEKEALEGICTLSTTTANATTTTTANAMTTAEIISGPPLENFPAPAEEEHGGAVFRDKAAGGLEKHLPLFPW